MEAILFNGWFTLLRTVVVGILAYAGLGTISSRFRKANAREDERVRLDRDRLAWFNLRPLIKI